MNLKKRCIFLDKLQVDIYEWGESLVDFHLPRWDELPELDLYMDQVITLVDRYLSPVIRIDKHTLLTSSMVNNYVKKGMIPPPEKKRYTRRHVAFLIAITLLKQVLTIPEIKNGILFQGKAVGIRNAYNLFCEEQETAVQHVCLQAMGQLDRQEPQKIAVEYLAVKAATVSFANKLFAENVIEIESQYLEKGESHD
jgi:DNA-binding transcriptional MerR regulator